MPVACDISSTDYVQAANPERDLQNHEKELSEG